jgi:hypothetical protein
VRAAALSLLLAALVPAFPASAATPPRVGDGRLTTEAPRRGHVLACAKPAGARAPLPPWIVDGRIDRRRKPVVDGRLDHTDALFALRRAGSRLAFSGNGLPATHSTGFFPPLPGDDAAPFALDTNAAAHADLGGDVPARPRRRRAPACVSATEPVGVALDGVPILPPHSSAGEDLAARSVTDACGGRTDADGRYFYRAALSCLPRGPRRGHGRQLGIARDGHAIFGPRGARGRFLRSHRLDACHGHAHRVTIRGERRRAYHHHVTADFPYVVGCFRARPSRTWRHIAQRIAFPPPKPVADVLVELAPAPAPGTPAIAGVDPAFDPSIPDYHVRCAEPVQLQVAAPDGVTVSVDGRAARGGEFTEAVALGPSESFSFDVAGGPAAGRYHARCLPPDFPVFDAQRTGATQAAMYIATPSLGTARTHYVVVFAADGVPLWWHRTAGGPFDAKLLPDGTLAWAEAVGEIYGTAADQHYDELTLEASVIREMRTVGSPTDFHDLQVLENGNRLMLTYRERDGADLSPTCGPDLPDDAEVVDGEVQELTPAGDLVWSWNTKDHLALAESARWCGTTGAAPRPEAGRTGYDIVHVNSVDEAADGDVIVSMRHTDAVYRIDRATGDVEWKLGGTTTPESLGVVGDAYGDATFGGQHDARELPDGTIVVHDNRTLRSGPPRAVRFAIDTAARTATLVEELGDPEALSSFCCGSTRKLPGGNWVSSWGGVPLITEHTPSGRRVFRLVFDQAFSYRADPVLPGALSREELRAAMTAMHPR